MSGPSLSRRQKVLRPCKPASSWIATPKAWCKPRSSFPCLFGEQPGTPPKRQGFLLLAEALVAQCSATPATVPATPPCSATPFQTQISVRHLPGMGALRAQILKKFKIAWNFQSRLKISISLEIFNPDLQNSPQKNRGSVGGALENFKLTWKFQALEFFQDLGP